jgi:MoaA/NifB/PqqE/SkfB family radical SAM enzyme
MLIAVRRFLRLYSEPRLPSVESVSAREFFSALDKFQQDTFRDLRRRYPEPDLDSFCKLVAVKVANAFAAEYHFAKRHSILVSRPVQLQVDPTNACHLHCPSCLHSANTAWASRFDWPQATLRIGEFDDFCNEFGPFATAMALFRDGEPLLHRQFPEFVTLAKRHLLYTVTSTSLSMRIDADALVASGLDRLVAAIDGASATTYGRYRRGGDFGLVMENIRAIVRARKRQWSRKPWLVWQFLAFEHNAHEIQLATSMAREIGFDQLVVAQPHSVEHDDPSIKIAYGVPFGETFFTEPRNWCEPSERSSLTRNAERIEAIFDETWARRYEVIAELEQGPRAHSTCNWLYYSLTMDGARRITPCCLPPMGEPEPRHLVYANFSGKNVRDVINSFDAILARRQCRNGTPPDADVQRTAPYCINCTESPPPPMLPDVAGYLRSVDARRALPLAIHESLATSRLFAWPP